MVCVPIDSRDPDSFQPLLTPKVDQLLAEVDKYTTEDNKLAGKYYPCSKLLTSITL